MAAFKVSAYRGRRNWYRKICDYSQTVSDGPDKSPAREQAEALRRELAERSHRNRFGWTHIDVQAVADEPRIPEHMVDEEA